MSQTATAAREPLLRIAKREGTTMPQKIAVRAIAILLALVVDALFIFFVTGLNPLSVYGVMWSGTFANMTRFSWMLRDLSTLLCVGIALAPVSRLSGGNVQKVLVGRELAADPIVLMTAYAVRGLDINTSYTIYHLLNEQKKRGVAVIYVGEDLDVLLELCDRIVVLCGGKVNGILDGRKTTKEEVGLRMINLVKEEHA